MSAERPVLIVDDDDALRETLVDQLAVDGEFVATEAASVEAAEACLSSKDARFDAVILDVGLPDGDGRDLCSRLRKQGHRMPIIMLTGLDSETDVVKGLDCGANDYIAKPFKLAVLLARLRAQLRIFENSEDAVFTIGPVHISAGRQAVAGTREEPPYSPDREGGGDPQVPLPRRYTVGGTASAAERGMGLQRRRHHPHAGNPHLPPAPENRTRPGQRTLVGHRGRWLSPDPEGIRPRSTHAQRSVDLTS